MELYNNYSTYAFVVDSPVKLTSSTTLEYDSRFNEYHVQISESTRLMAHMYRLWLPLVYWKKVNHSPELQKINNITHILKIYSSHEEFENDKNVSLKIKNSFSMNETNDLPFPFEFTENTLDIINNIIYSKHNYPPIDKYLDFLKNAAETATTAETATIAETVTTATTAETTTTVEASTSSRTNSKK